MKRASWVVASCLLVVGCGRASAESDVIRARAFQVVDSKGMVRATLSLTPDDKPVLSLADKSGTTRAMMWVNTNGSPALELLDSKRTPRAAVLVAPDDSLATFVLRDAKGEVQQALSYP